MKKIRKAIFPVGGMGTRFLPATKSMPKEMLPIVDKPLIQYAVEEAIAAGIEEIIFVTGKNKTAIEDHFDRSFELEDNLRKRNNFEALEQITSYVSKPGSIVYTRQQEPMGLGHAVWCARNFIHDEPFAVLLADDFIYSKVPCLKQMMDMYEQYSANILAVMNVPDSQVSRYGIIDPTPSDQHNIFAVKGIVEKPDLSQSPSNLAVVGRYILDSKIFDVLETQQKGFDDEIQLTDAIATISQKQQCYGFLYEGERIDCGSKSGYIKANIRLSLDNKTISDDIAQYIRDII